MTLVIAVANQKGGVGKTTTVVSLGAALADRGLRVLVVDLDPQANATSALGQRQGSTTDGLYDALVEERPLDPAILPTPTEGLSLVPTSPDLAGTEIELVTVMAREFRLKRALDPLRGRYDIVLIDCPPSLGLLTVNALAAADEVIIPVQAEYLALEGLGHLSQTIELVRRNVNPDLRVRGIVLTMFDGRTNLARDVEQEVRRHFDNTFDAVIPRSVRLSEAPSHGLAIGAYAPNSPGAEAYAELADELIAQLALVPISGTSGVHVSATPPVAGQTLADEEPAPAPLATDRGEARDHRGGSDDA